MLRAALLAVAVLVFLGTLVASLFGGQLWPVVIWSGIAAIALGIERRLYGAARSGLPPAGWRATGERFVDDATGHMVEVWFDPASGARDYRRVD